MNQLLAPVRSLLHSRFLGRAQGFSSCVGRTGVVSSSLLLGCMLAFPVRAAADVLEGDDRAWLSAILDENEAVLRTLDSGSFHFSSVRRLAGTVAEAKGKVVWQGELERYDFEIVRRDSSGSSQSNVGKAIVTPKVSVNYDVTGRQLFRAVAGSKSIEQVLWVLPSKSWLLYDMEIPLRDIISSNGTFDYGSRRVSLDRGKSVSTLRLTPPGNTGFVEFRFDVLKGGLIQSVKRSSRNRPEYAADYAWEPVRSTWFLKSLTQRKRMPGEPWYDSFSLLIDDFELSPSISSDTFSESGLGVDRSVRVTTFTPGKGSTRTTGGHGVDRTARLREIGLSFREAGFSSVKRH